MDILARHSGRRDFLSRTLWRVWLWTPAGRGFAMTDRVSAAEGPQKALAFVEDRIARGASAIWVNTSGVIRFFLLDQPEEARADFSRAIEAEPRFIYPYTCRGWTYFVATEDDLAERDFAMHVQLDPGSFFAHFKLGILDYYRNDYQGALAHFDASLRCQPSCPYAWAWHLLTSKSAGRMPHSGWRSELPRGADGTDAMACQLFADELTPPSFEAAGLEGVPGDPDSWPPAVRDRVSSVHFYLGKWYQIHGDQKRALDHFEQALSAGRRTKAMSRLFAARELKCSSEYN